MCLFNSSDEIEFLLCVIKNIDKKHFLNGSFVASIIVPAIAEH